jgi:thiamine-phosphate pyrophosphorylase
VGPVFATGSKEGLPDPLGLDGLSALVAALSAGARTHAAAHPALPVLGIGGIDAGNAASVVGCGVQGVAVIGGIWRAGDPVAAARQLAAAVS